jgi:hypothetical protein
MSCNPAPALLSGRNRALLGKVTWAPFPGLINHRLPPVWRIPVGTSNFIPSKQRQRCGPSVTDRRPVQVRRMDRVLSQRGQMESPLAHNQKIVSSILTAANFVAVRSTAPWSNSTTPLS